MKIIPTLTALAMLTSCSHATLPPARFAKETNRPVIVTEDGLYVGKPIKFGSVAPAACEEEIKVEHVSIGFSAQPEPMNITSTKSDVYESIKRDMKCATDIENERIIFEYLRNNVVNNDAQAYGILYNIYRESTFNPNAKGYGGDYGLVQWVGSRYDSFIYYCNFNIIYPSDINSQLAYLKKELEENYSKTYEKILACPDTVDGIGEVAYLFCKYFEVPYDTENEAEFRRNKAIEMYGEAFK